MLISHPDTDHLGGLPHAIAKLGLEAKVFATLPVVKMGQMFLYDHCLSKKVILPPHCNATIMLSVLTNR